MSAKMILAGVGIFVAGAITGVAGTLLYQNRYWEEAEEDDSEDEEFEEEPSTDRFSSTIMEEANKVVRDYRQYQEKASKYAKVTDEPEPDDSEPCLITADEYESIPGYDSEQLYFYTNGIVADVDDCIIKNPGALLGMDFMDYFDEDATEVVYIRNPRNHTEYELELVKTPFTEEGDNAIR